MHDQRYRVRWTVVNILGAVVSLNNWQLFSMTSGVHPPKTVETDQQQQVTWPQHTYPQKQSPRSPSPDSPQTPTPTLPNPHPRLIPPLS